MNRKKKKNVIRKNLSCDDQYLYPEGIYALNRVLDEIQDELRNESAMSEESMVIVPMLFNKMRRTFHFAPVLGYGWGPPEIGGMDFKEKFLLPRALGFLCELAGKQEEFNKASENCMYGSAYHSATEELRHYVDWLEKQKKIGASDDECIRKLANEFELVCSDDGEVNESKELQNQRRLIRNLHLFYYAFKTHRELYLPGILYQGMLKYSKESGVEYFKGNPVKDENEKNPSLYKGCFLTQTGRDTDPCLYNQFEVSHGNNATVTHKSEAGKRGADVLVSLAELFYLDELDQDKNRKQWHRDGPILILPIYDVWLGGVSFGGLWGCLICTFKGDESRNLFINGTLEKFLPRCEALADELFKAGLESTMDETLQAPYDLVLHFVKTITHIQDWERISVYHNKGEKTERLYCYSRKLTTEGDHSSDYEWDLCEGKNCSECESKNDNGVRMLSWNERKLNIWRPELIPELTEEEIGTFQDITLEFEFPEIAYVPSKVSSENEEDATRDHFENAIILQQIEVIRLLIPKVQARRAALRNAAVSIMARNMSHNIGSHVIAAVRSDDKAEIDEINRLNEHLQRRMDFIAELATAEAQYAADNELFSEVLGVDKGNSTVDGEGKSGLNGQLLLLRHISGSQTEQQKPIKAEITIVDKIININNKKTEEQAPVVSFRSGLLGWQALYVILENIIRNVAKHSGKQLIENKISIFMKVYDTDDDFFEVRIWDTLGTANNDVRDKPGIKVVGYLAETMKNPGFLKQDNSVDRSDWGMKEMYISAAFLRRISLSDLEGCLPQDQPRVIQVCAMDTSGNVRCKESECMHDDGTCIGNDECNGDATYNNLGFRLWLPKTKKVAVIVDTFPDLLINNSDDINKELRQKGVDFFDAATVRAGEMDIIHRYGVWLSDTPVPDELRAKLPVDLIECDSTINRLIANKLEDRDVQGLIKDVRNLVHAKRLSRLRNGKESKLWTYNRVGAPAEIHCGNELSQLTLKDFQVAVVFDWHGDGVSSRLQNWRREKCIRAGTLPPTDVIDKFAFYESFRSYFPQNGLFPSLSRDAGDAFKNELLIAALTPVVILDERFQRITAKEYTADYAAAISKKWRENFNEHFSMGKIWKRMRVYVPNGEEECNLEQPKLNEIKKYLKSISEKIGKGAYVVVHQSIFEKLDAQEKLLTEYLTELAVQENWINVVCSGRGVPWQLLERALNNNYRPRFAALSALLECLEHMPSKVHLIRLLEVTRAPNRT